MNSETQTVIIICAILTSVAFIVLITALIPTLFQLRILFKELAVTSKDIRVLVESYSKIATSLENKLEKLDNTIDAAQRFADNVSTAIKAGWTVITSMKEEKRNERQ